MKMGRYIVKSGKFIHTDELTTPWVARVEQVATCLFILGLLAVGLFFGG